MPTITAVEFELLAIAAAWAAAATCATAALQFTRSCKHKLEESDRLSNLSMAAAPKGKYVNFRAPPSNWSPIFIRTSDRDGRDRTERDKRDNRAA